MTNPIPEIPDRHFNHASSLPSVLLTPLSEARESVRQAVLCLRATQPNQRDFIGDVSGWQQAIIVHKWRESLLMMVAKSLEMEAEKIDEQATAR
jgi:hypothetical protein